MKNLCVFFVFILVTTICGAQIELECNSECKYRIKEDVQEWAPSEITAEPGAIKYIDNFSRAIQNPDIPILVDQSEKILKLKPIFKKLVEIEEYFIIYNSQTKNIDYIEVAPTKEEESSYLILFSIVSIFLMIISNILYKKGQAAAAFAFVVAAVAFADINYKVASIIFYILMVVHIILLFV
jgi:hypothetical protein